MCKYIGFILLAISGAACVIWMLDPLALIVPLYVSVMWVFCPDYNALAASCNAATPEFIVARVAAAALSAVLVGLLIWLAVRWRKP